MSCTVFLFATLRSAYGVAMLEPQLSHRPIESPDQSPIFVIGTGRSGTTLLRQMLNAHPRIYISHEAGFYSYLRHAPKGISAHDWLERYFQTYSYAFLHLDPQQVCDSLPTGLTLDRAAEIFQVIMRAKAAQQGKVRYGEKNPLDTQNLPRIFADFPAARVVCIMRDPRPTVESFNRMPFGTTSVLLNTYLCRVQFAHIEPYLDRILEVRLEDLSADPRRTMQSILHFIGEPWDDAVLEHVQRSQVDDVPSLPWFVKAKSLRPNQKDSGSEGSEPLTPAWLRLIEKINRVLMIRYGYESKWLEQEPTLWEYLRALLGDVAGIAEATYRLLAMKRLIDRHFQGKALLDPQRGMEENLQLNPAAWRYYPSFEMPQVPRLPVREESPLSLRLPPA